MVLTPPSCSFATLPRTRQDRHEHGFVPVGSMKIWWLPLPPSFVPAVVARSSSRNLLPASHHSGRIFSSVTTQQQQPSSSTIIMSPSPPELPSHRAVCLYGVEGDAPAASPSSSSASSTSSSSFPPFEITTQPMPTLSPKSKNEVLVRVVAAGLNPADAKRVVGDKLPASWTSIRSWFDRYYLRSKIPGFDFAGVVVRVPESGSSTSSSSKTMFKVGDRVFGMVPPFVGTLTNYLVAPVDQIAHMPPHLDFDKAAALALVGVTVVQVLQPLNVKDKSVLVVGASGGTGHVALQVARAMEARAVVAVCGTSNADFCRTCGATHVVSYQDGPQALLERLLTGCEGASPFDVVLDCVTSDDPRDTGAVDYPTLLQQSTTSSVLLAPGYQYRRLGGPPLDWVRAGIEMVTGSTRVWKTSHEKLFWIRLPNCSRELEQLAKWSGRDNDSGTTPKVEPTVSATFDFTQAGVTAAMDAIMSRRVRGKVVVRIADD